jgi:hypothetical protein
MEVHHAEDTQGFGVNPEERGAPPTARALMATLWPTQVAPSLSTGICPKGDLPSLGGKTICYPPPPPPCLFCMENHDSRMKYTWGPTYV